MNSARTIVRVLAATLLAGAATASAQDYPSRPVRLVVPTSPGGGTDITARTIAPRLGEQLGQQVVVENRAGASTMIGMEHVARAAPDGYTIAMGISSLTIQPHLRSKVPYDALRDFAPVSQVLKVPHLLVAHPSLPAQSVKELITFAKSRPGQLNYAAGSVGSNAHMAMELLASMAGLKMVHVPYKGTGPALSDTLAGHLSLMMANLMAALPHVKNGRLRAYGVSSAQRAGVAREIPTIAEAGLKGYEVVQWFGIFAPAKTPPDVIGRLHAATVQALQDPAIRQRLVSDGAEPVGNTPAAFADVVREEHARWARLISAAGIHLK
jgi:tripartite-type tricarboxylate transporter receptor subunit TctC